MYYIMNASCLFGNKSATVEMMAETWSDSTILVCRRETGYDKSSRVFVSGAGMGYEDELALGQTISRRYTQDTGNGYTNTNKELVIENVISVMNGKVVDSGNGIGINEKRRAWVMK